MQYPKSSNVPYLTVVRHGQSSSNAGGVSMENHLIPLTPLGQQQAQALATLLPAQPASVYASPFLRALQTAEPYVQRTGSALHMMETLQEFQMLDMARVQGMTGAERHPLAQQYWQQADPHLRMGAGAETFQEFHQRVQDFHQGTLPGLPAGTVLFGHGTWMAMLCWQLLGFAQGDSQSMGMFHVFKQGLPMPNGAVYQLYWQHGLWRIQADERLMRSLASHV